MCIGCRLVAVCVLVVDWWLCVCIGDLSVVVYVFNHTQAVLHFAVSLMD